MTPYIPERFRRRVITHVVGVVTVETHPLLLAVQGKPGDGKSFQLKHSLNAANCSVFSLSASLLAGQWEGDAVAAVKELYTEAGRYARMNPESLPVLIIEDFDLSPAGQRDGVQYTVNSQLLAGFLMHLADDVSSCDVETAERLPIFITGNDLTTLHGPLTRPGRMEIFSWEPSTDERVEIVHSFLLPHLPSLKVQQVARMVKEHRKQPISMFAAALTDCLAQVSYEIAVSTGSIGRAALRRAVAEKAAISLDDYFLALAQRADPQFSLRTYI